MSLYIGLMSGTSVDAIDAVIVDFSTHPPKLVQTLNFPIPENLARQIHQYYENPISSLQNIGESHVALGQLFADATLHLLDAAKLHATDITAIGSHGQTIFHHPEGPHPFSMQLGDPNVIAARTGITTVGNFRNKDLALGGQGAPLTPFFHESVLRLRDKNRLVINIGGITNITHLPGSHALSISGYDVGPGNTLLDRFAEQNLQQPFDHKGEWARSGTILPTLLNKLLNDPYFHRPMPKSTGREYFNLSWLEKSLTGVERTNDVQRTLVELTAQSIANSVLASKFNEVEIIICGGGVHNTFLMEQITACCQPRPVNSSLSFGLDPNWVEAMAFAWFAKQSLSKTAINLHSVTGANKSAVLGNIVYS